MRRGVCACVGEDLAASLTVINLTCHDFHQYKHLLPAHDRLQEPGENTDLFLSLSFALFQNLLSAFGGSILRHCKKVVPKGRRLKGRYKPVSLSVSSDTKK